MIFNILQKRKKKSQLNKKKSFNNKKDIFQKIISDIY